MNITKTHHQSLLVTLVLCWRSLSIAQVGTPWRVGSKRVVLIFLSRIPLMCTLGAFLISFEGMNTLFIVEDPRATSRCRTGIKALFLDNFDILNVYCVSCCHTQSLHILPYSILLHFFKNENATSGKKWNDFQRSVYATLWGSQRINNYGKYLVGLYHFQEQK